MQRSVAQKIQTVSWCPCLGCMMKSASSPAVLVTPLAGRGAPEELSPMCCTVPQWLSWWATKDAVRVDVGGKGGPLKLYWAYEDLVWVKPCRYSPGLYARLTEPVYLRAVLTWQQGVCSRSGQREKNQWQ